MNFSGWRTIVRVTATGALSTLAAGALLGTSPAHADPADDGALIWATPVVVDGSYGQYRLQVTHLAKGTDFKIKFDLAKLDPVVVRRVHGTPDTCTTPDANTVLCAYTMDYAAGAAPILKVALPFQLERVPGGSGKGGSITASLVTTAPIHPTQGSATFTVDVPDKTKVPTHGVDLVLATHDVYELGADGYTNQPVLPGHTSAVLAAFANYGDTTANGVKVAVQLPQHVTFAEREPGCTYTADNRSVTCDYKTIVLAPISTDPDPTKDDDGVISAGGAWFPITVAADAPAPVVLTGGTFTATPLGAIGNSDGPSALAANQAKGRNSGKKADDSQRQLPKGLKPLAAVAKSVDMSGAARKHPAGRSAQGLTSRAAAGFADADLTDNTGNFAVHVGSRPATGGAPAAGTSAGGPSLPVTGAPVRVLGGVGGGAAILGVALYLLARRRRVVLVTPSDEESSA